MILKQMLKQSHELDRAFHALADATRAMLADPEVRLPGERRQTLAEQAMREGIVVAAPLHAQLKTLASA